MHSKVCALVFAACISLGTQARADVIHPDDYAYGSALETDGGGALYSVTLDEDQYRHTFRADLADLCVINGRNEVVPFAIRRPEGQQSAVETFAPLPMFPLQGEDRVPSESLRLRLRAGGTSIELEQPHDTAAAQAGAYLIDARGSQEPLTVLHLAWPEGTSDFSKRVSVEASEDLTRWRAVVSNAPIAYLHYAGQAFVRAEISVGDTKASFLRVSWSDASPPVTLTGISGQRRPSQIEQKRMIASVAGVVPQRTADGYEFDLGAHLPIDRLNLELPELNTLVDVQFLARLTKGDAWAAVTRGRLYRLKVPGSDDLTNAALAIPVTLARYWKVRINAAGGGLGSGSPVLEAGWLPDQLLFVARGAAPFRLLYGDSRSPALGLAPSSLLDGTDADQRHSIQAQPARMGAPIVLGGESRLDSPLSGTDWKRWLLWAVLLLGVAALATMAWRLSRSLNSSSGA